MEIIKNTISPSLKTAVITAYAEVANYFQQSVSKLINHRVIYCNKWSTEQNKKYAPLLEQIKAECVHLTSTFAACTLIQLNFLNAPPDCNTQLFHLDYKGDSISYFIPLVDLTDLNGTEYLMFYDKKNYGGKTLDLIKTMNEQYFDRDEAIAFLAQHDLFLKRDYEFRYANAEAFALLHMPFYTYHRGQKNKTKANRIMLNILFSIENKYDFPTDEYVPDTEIDEQARSQQVLEKRWLAKKKEMKSKPGVMFCQVQPK